MDGLRVVDMSVSEKNDFIVLLFMKFPERRDLGVGNF